MLLAGADAHANLQLTNGDPGDSGFALPIPGYETSFRVMSVHVRPDRPLTGDATRDATTVMQAIRRGHVVHRHRRPRHPAGLSIHGDQCPRRPPAKATRSSPAAASRCASAATRLRRFVTMLWRDGEPLPRCATKWTSRARRRQGRRFIGRKSPPRAIRVRFPGSSAIRSTSA